MELAKAILVYLIVIIAFILISFAARAISAPRKHRQEARFNASQENASELPQLPEFTPDDRVLILAPHPDDEAIGTAGVIQRALSRGAKLKVVYLTNGDSNELSFLVYEKRPMLIGREAIELGEIRINESRSAMKLLGLNDSDVVFLGYPDFGTLSIFVQHWKRPYRSFITRLSKVSYKDALSPGAPYLGESILSDLESVMKKFKPTKIFVSSPADRNPDHQALFLYSTVALLDLNRSNALSQTEVFPYLVHFRGWPSPSGYAPNMYISPPSQLSSSGMHWEGLNLSPEELSRKHEAILAYQSQNSYSPRFLPSFARQNEIFGSYELFLLNRQKEGNISWLQFEEISNLELQGNISDLQESYDEASQSLISNVAYAYSNTSIFVRLILRRSFEPDRKISLFLFGYSSRTNFSEMPKIRLVVSPFATSVYDGERRILSSGASVSRQKGGIIVKVPLKLLGKPDYVLTATKTGAGEMPVSETFWRVLVLE